MPDFFLIAGLFLSHRITRPWRSYLDSKVLHFGYFYVLWMTIQFATKGFDFYREDGFGGLLHGYLNGVDRPLRHAVVHLHACSVLRRGKAGPVTCRRG